MAIVPLFSHGHRAIVLCMIRRRLLRPDQLAWSELCPGRLIYVRLHLTRIHDIICIYQHSWSSLKDRHTLLQDRLQVFEAIRHCIHHVPKSHMLLLAGDCNTPLTVDAPHVHSRDPKYGQAAHCDKQDFQTMIRDLDLVAVHCQHHWQPTFKHRNHTSRIDFMFVRRHQVQWTKHRAQVLTHFERTVGSSAPVHHPLVISLPRWFAPPRQQPPINSIDRHRLRLEYQSQTENWLTFETEVMHTVRTHTDPPKSDDPITTCIQVEQAIRQLCQNHFPRVRQHRPLCSQVKSLAAQMWFARRQLLRLRSVSMQAIFQSWSYVIRFEKLHTIIRRQSRQNRKNRLDIFLAESVPFVLQSKLHDWYKRIRTLCPKHSFRRIQLFDMHGAPLSQAQELARLTQYYQELFTDSQAPIMTPPALNQLPFTEADVLHELQHLLVTKALAPDGFPALIWRHFASILTPVMFPCISHAWCQNQNLPPSHWSAGWLHLLAKPNKIPNQPAALRPICLQHPMHKVMSSIHCRLFLG